MWQIMSWASLNHQRSLSCRTQPSSAVRSLWMSSSYLEPKTMVPRKQRTVNRPLLSLKWSSSQLLDYNNHVHVVMNISFFKFTFIWEHCTYFQISFYHCQWHLLYNDVYKIMCTVIGWKPCFYNSIDTLWATRLR